GLVPRVDIRRIENSAEYRFRPEGRLIAWGPEISTERIWDHRGLRLDEAIEPGLGFEMVGNTEFGYNYISRRERLRPKDFPALPGNRDFGLVAHRVFFTTDYHRGFGVSLEYQRGTGVNFVPPEGAEPDLASSDDARVELRLRPMAQLTVENRYLLSRLRDRRGGALIFIDHTLRSRWNWQFNKRLSLRVIPQYEATLSNPARTRLARSKRFNADFLFTYLVNPWSALYVGYNSDLRNLDVLRQARVNRLARTADLRDTGKQLFVKLSWLLRF
ncbi:MAG: hypothetical protein GY953_39140, partial [bacterium]|nr:hypothetical protein [bacterium]